MMGHSESCMPPIQFLPTTIPDVRLLSLPRFSDARGWFAETWNPATFAAALASGAEGAAPVTFVQDNQSYSLANVLRGLHYQLGRPQGKLIRVLAGRIFDVALDLRRGSPTFGRHAAVELSAPVEPSEPARALWIPEGFAHGFFVLSGPAEVLYKSTAPYYPEGERTILWNDPELGIRWPMGASAAPILSCKDAAGLKFAEAIWQGAVFD
jgi:dTDP-4-dehydrorhamnose 3,5-epimerase